MRENHWTSLLQFTTNLLGDTEENSQIRKLELQAKHNHDASAISSAESCKSVSQQVCVSRESPTTQRTEHNEDRWVRGC